MLNELITSAEDAQAATLVIEKGVETLEELRANPFHQDVWNSNDGLDEDALKLGREMLHLLAMRTAELWGRNGEFSGGYQSGGYYD